MKKRKAQPEITYSHPDGGSIDNPSLEELRKLILHGDEEYWQGGSGEGSLETTINGRLVSLSLMLEEPYGFLLMGLEEDSTDHYMSESSDDYSTTVTHYYEGEPWVVPTAFFVSRELALEAAQEFCRSGHRSKSIKWVLLGDREW